MKGPVPTQLSGLLRSPYCSTASLAMIQVEVDASASRNQAKGSFSVNLTVDLSTTSILSTCSSKPRFGLVDCMKRSKLYFTSSAVTSRPFSGGLLCQRAPLRSLKTYVVSLGWSQDSARSGSSGCVPGLIDAPALTLTSRLWVKDSGSMVVNATVCWGSKCTGAKWKRMRKVPPRFGTCASALPG